MKFWKKRYYVAINYKSGITVKEWFYDISIRKDGGKLTNITWEPCNKNIVLYMGIDNIESIYVIKEKGFR